MKRKIISFILILCMALSVNTICNASYKSVAETEFEGHTYCLYDESLSWTEAKKYCESIGGYLAVITSEEEQEIIEELLENGKKNLSAFRGDGNDFFGSGILLLIPSLIQCINIKTNYVTYNKEMVSNTIFYCIFGLILNLISILFYYLFAFPRL